MKIKSIFLLTIFAITVSIQAMKQPNQPVAPDGPGHQKRYGPPAQPAHPDFQQRQPVRDVVQQQQIQDTRNWIDDHPKFTCAAATTVGLAAVFGLSYRYSTSFKKDIDEKVSRIQNYFKNKYTFNHFLGFSLGASVLGFLGYKTYTGWDDIRAKFRSEFGY